MDNRVMKAIHQKLVDLFFVTKKKSVVISDCSLHTKERSNMSTKTNPKFLTCKY